MSDVFEEVEGQIRSERYRALAMKALPWVLALAAAALITALAIWGWDSYTKSRADKASETYMQALEARAQNDQADAFTKFGEVARSGAKGYRALALLQQGGMRMEAGKTDEAVKLWDEAASVSSDPMLADLARLKSALALLDTAPYKDLEGRLTPLMEDKRPFRLNAREALAFARLMAGKTTEARGDFVFMSQVLGATDGQRKRAQAAINLIDSGSAGAIPVAVKAAALLPPVSAGSLDASQAQQGTPQ
ncbi:MAG: tetratricopeptide repeat protein [Caulobacter sp.]|nr:tetratricopeptide repeat protein [Caulobacter sp.]MDP1966601.1 tetratricopeptide repeat protein [Reyranella sp.]